METTTSPIKKCACGLEHFEIPADATWVAEKNSFPGVYWNCHCGSTLFLPASRFPQHIDAILRPVEKLRLKSLDSIYKILGR